MDSDNSPIADAVITIRHQYPAITALSGSDGAFTLLAPQNLIGRQITVEASNSRFLNEARLVPVMARTPPLMFRMERHELVMGMPRSVFLIVAGKSLGIFS